MNKQIRTRQPIAKSLILTWVFLVALLAPMAAQGAVYASPLSIFAADPGTSCDLPDGTGGVIGKDHVTCCPPQAQDGESCLYAKYINPFIRLLSAAVGIVVVIAIVYGAMEYTTSNGDPQRAAAGKSRIVNALIGLVAFILLLAFLQFIIPGGLDLLNVK